MSKRDAQSSDVDEAKQKNMFELTDINGKITLDCIYQNDLHALKRLEVRNLSDQPILVKMRSNLRSQLHFQLNNENIVDLPEQDLRTVTTNSVAWSQSAMSQDYQCNQLFNNVNYIEEIALEPFQSRVFVLVFLPETPNQNDPDAGRSALEDQEDSCFDSFNVTGSLFFFGYRLDQMAQLDEKSQQDVLVTSSLADYQLSVKFRASVCRSMLWTDVADVGFNFDDCVLGETYHKDFVIENRSGIELYWLLNTVDLSKLNRNDWIQFSDRLTGEPLDHRPIGEYKSRLVRLTFMPKEVGEFNYDLQLENVNDARNVIQTRIHATVRSVRHKESLVVSSGNVIDFGDCTSGHWTVEQLELSNVSELPVEVRFLPEGADVVFDIKAALDESEEHNVILPRGDAQGRPALGRNYSKELSLRSAGSTPTATVASTERSAPTSVLSSRASSPTPLSQTMQLGDTETASPISLETVTTKRQPQTPRAMTNEESDSEMGTGNGGSSIGAGGDTSSIASESESTLSATESYTRIEDLVLKAGKSRVILVSYRPQKDANITDFNAGQLIRRNFRIVLEYGHYRSAEPKERKAIQCRARTCTSFVEAIPKEINFGDTDVGTLKSRPINIFNRSDITARVELQFSSKVLNCLRGEIAIPARSFVELKLDLYPRKVNPCYRKQITLVNYLNKDNNQIIEVQSTNIDKNRVTFHSLYYRILTATGANFLDFGPTALNSPALRAFTVENIRDKPLKLGITTSIPDDIVIYTKRRRTEEEQQQAQAATEKEKPSQTKDIRADFRESFSQRRLGPAPQKLGTAKHGVQNGQKDAPTAQQHPPAQHQQQQHARPVHQLRTSRSSPSTAYLDLATSPSLPRASQHRRRVAQIVSDKSTWMKDEVNKRPKAHRPSRGSMDNENTHKETDTKPGSASGGHSLGRSDSFDTNRAGKKKKQPMGITAPRYKSRKNLDWSDIAGKARVPFEDLISVLEHGSKASPPLFPKQSAEEQFVRYQLAWRQELMRLIEKGDLVRTSLVEVDPQSEEEVVIVFTPDGSTKPNIQNAPKKQNARIFLRLAEFDRNIDQAEFESLLDLDQDQIPLREIIVRAQLCRSAMDLGQKNINFGIVERNERHEKSIVLHNRSETPLLYAIRKSGSIASGDIDLGAGRYGVVRAFGKREIDFVFEPTLPGAFAERLVVENIRDRTNDQVLLLKAMVRKPSPFFIKSLELSFGPCLVEQACQRTETIVLTNTKKQTRLFEIRVDPNELDFGRYYGEFDFTLEDDVSTLSKEAEEEIENLEQKLKIATRKGQADKVKKYLKKLAKLKNTEPEQDDAAGEDAPPPQQPLAEAKPTTEEEVEKKKSVEDLESSSDPPWKENAIFKKTSESIVFPLDPLATKTITVYFKVVSAPVLAAPTTEVDARERVLPVKGHILVHEYKNTDVCKSIVYDALICSDQTAYNEALSSLMENEGSASRAAAIESVVPPEETQLTGETSSVAAKEDVKEDHVEALKFERSFFDGGKVEVNQRTIYYARVSNDSDEPLEYEFIVSPEEQGFFLCPAMTSPLDPRETRKVTFEILPTQVGKQQHTLSLRNGRTGSIQHFTLQCVVHRRQYLAFPSLSEAKGELDLGFSYIDPGNKYSQVTPLLVENVSDQDLSITCQSNLSQQVLIFMDEKGEQGVVEQMPCKRGSTNTVWVAVQPSLLTGYLGSSSDECRELVGGIKFSVFVQDDAAEATEGDDDHLLLMLTQTVKFTSIIGQSHLEVSDQVINLGYTDFLLEGFYGVFTIENKSGQLPLDYKVECPTLNITLDRHGGTLAGRKGKTSTFDAVDKDEEDACSVNNVPLNTSPYRVPITFRMLAHRYGLLNEKIIVTNAHNSQESFEVEIRLFVDCKRLDMWTLPARHDFREVEKHAEDDLHREARPLPLIMWENIYVSELETKKEEEKEEGSDGSVPKLSVVDWLDEEDAAGFYRREIEVANVSNEQMQLVALSDVDVKADWVKDAHLPSTTGTEKSGPLSRCSGVLLLAPGERVRARLRCPSPDKLHNEGRYQALEGHSGSLKGILSLYDQCHGMEVMALELEALYCVSVGELVKDRIDLDEIGHTTSWKSIPFSVAVHNVADVPLCFEAEGPDFVSFKSSVERNEPTCWLVAPHKTLTIEGTVDPQRMQDHSSGLQRFDVLFVNKRNKSNVMRLRLKAMMTVFELCFERLSHGELELPPLRHPIMPENDTCDNWFEIRNTTDDDIRFEIGTEMSPDVEGYVKLDVLSRYSNSPLKGGITLSPQAKMEVRVRASPNEASRLPQERPDLMDPAGIILATLWVTTRPVDDEVKVREEIPVRCRVEEACVFSLSEKRLDFKLITYYREDAAAEAKAKCMPPSCPLTILNEGKQPLRFQLTVEGPDEFAAQGMVRITPPLKDGKGVVEAGQAYTLTVAIDNSKDSLLGQFRIHVDDLDALGSTRQTTTVDLVEIVRDL